jgi:YHS domain-containing protein
MKTLLTLIATLGIFAGTALADPVNKLCPVSGKAGDPAVTADYKKKISFCCEKCKAKFDKDPKSFGKEIAAYKADSDKCIFSGKAVDKAQSSEFKVAVTTCCENCKGKFESDPDKYIEKALKK